MMDFNQQNQEKSISALPMPHDYYAVLLKMIDAASKDPAKIRKLVYALAWYNFGTESLLSRSLLNAPPQAKTISELARTLAIEQIEVDVARRAKTILELERSPEPERVGADTAQQARTIELERVLELERAIARVEADAAQRASTVLELERALGLERAIARVEAHAAQQPQELKERPELRELQDLRQLQEAQEPQQSIRPSQAYSTSKWKPLPEQMNSFTDGWNVIAQHPRDLDRQFNPPAERHDPLPVRASPSHDNAVSILPERPPAWLQRPERAIPVRPAWVDQRIGVSADTVDYVPIRVSHSKRGLRAFLQLVAAAVVGVALFVGVSGMKVKIAHWEQNLSAMKARLSKVEEIAQQGIAKEPTTLNTQPLHTPITLGKDEVMVIRQFIKVLPSNRGIQQKIRVGDEVSDTGSAPVPESLVSQMPKLRGATFLVEHNGAIIIIAEGSKRADAVIEPQ